MNRSEANEKARKHISNAGIGTGSIITTHSLKCMMVDFYLDNQVKKLAIYDVIDRLQSMKSGVDLQEFDQSKRDDMTYCVEWGIKKGEWITDGVIDRYIEELNSL